MSRTILITFDFFKNKIAQALEGQKHAKISNYPNFRRFHATKNKQISSSLPMTYHKTRERNFKYLGSDLKQRHRVGRQTKSVSTSDQLVVNPQGIRPRSHLHRMLSYGWSTNSQQCWWCSSPWRNRHRLQRKNKHTQGIWPDAQRSRDNICMSVSSPASRKQMCGTSLRVDAAKYQLSQNDLNQNLCRAHTVTFQTHSNQSPLRIISLWSWCRKVTLKQNEFPTWEEW